MEDTGRTVDYIMFGGEKVEKCLECGCPTFVETEEKGLYACQECGAGFYGDDHENTIFI
jgi:ribosomal protein L37AE/L43A